MIRRSSSFIISLLMGVSLAIFASSPAFASGSYGGSNSYQAPKKQIDQNYEIGKSIYSGRKSSAGKLNYCLNVEGEFKKVGRSSVKAHKRSTYNDFSEQLVNCDEPETKIAQQISKDELLYVLYYLNKRFNLYLT